MSIPYRFASLFSGCGGLDLGFSNAGFTPAVAFDNDEAAIMNHRRHFQSPAFRTDLRDGLPLEHRLCGIDALIAGPPCQGFSTAGKRRFDDDRNHLLTLTGVLARRVRPRVVVVENVAGALSGEHARYWHELTAMMRDAGYRTHALDCQAAELGMAQMRRRMLLLAWRTGREARFPLPQLSPGRLADSLRSVSGVANHKPHPLKRGSVERRIAAHIRPGQKLCNVRGGANAIPTWSIPEVFGDVSPEEVTVLEMLRRLRRQDRARTFGDADPVSLTRLESALGTPFKRLLNSLIARGYVRRTGDHLDLAHTFNGKYRRLSWDGPSYTVDTRFGAPRYFLHPDEHRGFTVREAARIQGFPDDYIFHGSEQAQYRLIGNAVPPPLAELAARFTAHLLGA